MDFGVRQAAMSNGCLGGCLKALIVGGLILLLGPFALVTWLSAQGSDEPSATPAPRTRLTTQSSWSKCPRCCWLLSSSRCWRSALDSSVGAERSR